MKHNHKRLFGDSLLLLATLPIVTARGSPGVQPIASPSSTPASSPTGSTTPATPTVIVPDPVAPDQAAQLHYFWPTVIPDGLIVDAMQSQATDGGFTLELIDPVDAQRALTLFGGATADRSPAIGSEPITVRGHEGVRFSTGAGFGDHLPRRTGQETMCQSDHCADINSAMYLTPSDLRDPQRLAGMLAAGLG